MLDSEIRTPAFPKNSGFAKAILFGEHSVVYGHPAIVCGVGIGATTEVVGTNRSQSLFNFIGVEENFSVRSDDEESIAVAFAKLFEVLEIPQNVELEVRLEIPTGAGLGSSAAIGVSVSRALINHFSLSADKLNPAVEAFETVFHASPSGVDQAAATSGGVFAYNKSDGIENISYPDLDLVIANVGSRCPTHEIVKDFAAQREKDENRFLKKLDRMREIAKEGILALAGDDKPVLGKLMDENHFLLKGMTVSSDALDEACVVARHNGALGAKMTGAGRGGCMIALVEPGNNLVRKALADLGYWTHSCHLSAKDEY